MRRILGLRMGDTLRASAETLKATFNSCYNATLIGHQYDYDQIRATAAAANAYAAAAPSDKETLANMYDKLSGLVAETQQLLETDHKKKKTPDVNLVLAFTSALSACRAVAHAHDMSLTPRL